VLDFIHLALTSSIMASTHSAVGALANHPVIVDSKPARMAGEISN
jgi:hypothetical protein